MLAARTGLFGHLRLLAPVAFMFVAAPLPTPTLAQEAHGAIAAGFAAYGDYIAFGLSWSHGTKVDAIDAALRGCSDGGGTTCQEIAWFRNGCGALAVNQHGDVFGKSAISQDQAEARAMQSCEAAGGTGCSVAGSQCAVPGEQAGSWSGSERVVAISETDTATQQAEQQAQAPEAQEEALTREQRVHAQRGLSLLGFEAGPTDGIFGSRTRAAIRDWQDAKGLEATGYLTMAQAEALAAVALGAGESQDVETEEAAAQEPVGTAAESETPSQDGSAGQVLFFATCGTDEEEPDGCWLPLSSPAGCVMWSDRVSDENLQWSEYLDETSVTWSGKCDPNSDNRAHGRGEVKYSDGWSDTGELIEGRRQGHWVGRNSRSGYSDDAFFVDGQLHGRLVSRYSDGTVYCDEYRHGEHIGLCDD